MRFLNRKVQSPEIKVYKSPEIKHISKLRASKGEVICLRPKQLLGQG